MTDTPTTRPTADTDQPAHDEAHGETDRYRRGVELMEAVQGPEVARQIRNGFAEISPDFGRYVVEAGFADVYGRPGLSLAQRQLINVAVLTAIGGAENQLAVHIRGALNVGISPAQILETLFHVALYAGHPRTGNGLQVAAQVFAERGIDPIPPTPDTARDTEEA
jgi:4-carboxymuconolactone decarboxylase